MRIEEPPPPEQYDTAKFWDLYRLAVHASWSDPLLRESLIEVFPSLPPLTRQAVCQAISYGTRKGLVSWDSPDHPFLALEGKLDSHLKYLELAYHYGPYSSSIRAQQIASFACLFWIRSKLFHFRWERFVSYMKNKEPIFLRQALHTIMEG